MAEDERLHEQTEDALEWGWVGRGRTKACVEELAQRCLNNEHAVRHERKI